ncbi:MAG: OmpA family protein [Acidimicrobiia bacterium]
MTKRRRLALLGGLWIVLAVGGVIWASSSIDSDIEDGTRAALAGSGVGIEVDGRDVTLIGDPDPTIEALARGVDGVRTVRWRGEDGETAAPTSIPSTEPTGTETPASTAPATTEAPPATAPAGQASFRAGLVNGQLTLSGALPSSEVMAGIAQAADLVYAPLITDELVEDPAAPGGDWLSGLPQAVSLLPIAGNAAFEITGDMIVITGSTGSDEKKALLEGALRRSLGETLTYDNQVTVTGKTPPAFFANAGGDGTVVLAGAMPDQAAIDLIAAAAGQAFGPENVDVQMAIDDSTEATFSVFRIPFIFAPLSLVPQWEINIENDVISGGLRGGASFDFDSARLSPQLEQLATIAAGIIARNPTVAASIEGYTDSRGRAAYNLDLSQRRADAARDFIIALGIAPERLTAQGFGETSLLADNSTEAGRAQNRRIEFLLGPIEGGG